MQLILSLLLLQFKSNYVNYYYYCDLEVTNINKLFSLLTYFLGIVNNCWRHNIDIDLPSISTFFLSFILHFILHQPMHHGNNFNGMPEAANVDNPMVKSSTPAKNLLHHIVILINNLTIIIIIIIFIITTLLLSRAVW